MTEEIDKLQDNMTGKASANELPFMCGGGGRGLCAKGCGKDAFQLNIHDYLADIPGNTDFTDLVEVQFKNTRKGYYHNINHLPIEKGDVVAVEASPGHDIGTVTMTGKLVALQLKKVNLKSPDDIKRIYRKVKPVDMEKYEEAKAKEHETMIKSRQIAKNLGLEMKIGDVEYQGDGNKAIFYYIADGRVDFRQLIKVLAEEFRVRIEMKQIGARQEAGRIGGFGPCGRELCCATWMKNFVSVSTAAARFQDISLNPQKLAGQCAKLKCCMNYEADQYVEATRKLPSREITLHTADGEYFYFKADILSGMITYSTDKRMAANLTTIPAQRAMEIIQMNRKGENPETLEEGGRSLPEKPIDLATQEDLNRFDKKKKKKKRNNDKREDREAKRDSHEAKREGRDSDREEKSTGKPVGQREEKSAGKTEGQQEEKRHEKRNGEREPRQDKPTDERHHDRKPRRHGNRHHGNSDKPQQSQQPQQGE